MEAISAQGLQTSADEALFLNGNSRGCDVFAHENEEPGEVWGKIGFEWVAANQNLFEVLREQDVPYVEDVHADGAAEVMMHFSFHLHFGALVIATDAIRTVADEIQSLGSRFFGDDGGVVAEVSMTASEARLECVRYEVNTSAPLVAENPWWDEVAEVCRVVLDKLESIYQRLSTENGSQRGPSES